ncbi:hypothetical protein [Actinacidiphila guanduensis]|uniref:Uncharacterized protein n=1 Tax=Actinacidiphila guanduensis TaxID=310781 RepID=A0A1H0SD82_9ACTN|nr:hypothetical protein [Actinacidiphila guanduensis]SDP39615.1 hypothetical protein SAMN05216259_12724 [Actinacidiphila guanduensis]
MAKEKSGDSSSSGKTLKITDTYLKDFAANKLDPFVRDVQHNRFVAELAAYLSGSPQLGHDENWNYNQLLLGNPNSKQAPIATFQKDFATFTGALSEKIQGLLSGGQILSQDCKYVDNTLDKGEDSANITASEMNADLANFSLDGSGNQSTSNVSISQ